MSVTVRCFAHHGLVALPISNYSGQMSVNAAFSLTYPYLARQTIVADSVPISSQQDLAPRGTQILRIEIQQGKVVHFEITPAGYEPRIATVESPRLAGRDQLPFGEGWTISVLEGAIAS